MKGLTLQGLVSINDSRLGCRLEKLSQTLVRFPRGLGFARIRGKPLSSQILYHNSIPVI